MILRSEASSVFTISSTVTDNQTYKNHRRQLQLRDYGGGVSFHVRFCKLLTPTAAVMAVSSGGTLACRKSRSRFMNVRSSATASDLSSSIQPPDVPTPGSGPDKVSLFLCCLISFCWLLVENDFELDSGWWRMRKLRGLDLIRKFCWRGFGKLLLLIGSRMTKCKLDGNWLLSSLWPWAPPASALASISLAATSTTLLLVILQFIFLLTIDSIQMLVPLINLVIFIFTFSPP